MLGSYNVGPSLAVKDMEAATAFYGGKLGLKVIKDDQDNHEIVYGSGSSTLHVYQSSYAGTNKATAAFWVVDDVDGEAAALRDNGIEFEHYPDLPGVKIKGDVHVIGSNVGEMRVVWFKDPDGNILCVHNKE